LLNAIWLLLIVLGTVFALVKDVRDLTGDRFRFQQALPVQLDCSPAPAAGPEARGPQTCILSVDARIFQRFYGLPETAGRPVRQTAELLPVGPGKGVLRIRPDDQTPPGWKELWKAQRNPEYLQARLLWTPGSGPPQTAALSFDPVHLIALNAVTQDGILHYAKVAVELAIGLIGVLALWLGLMKIAEQSGLIAALSRVLKPLMIRLFPDVPPEHPAMGAMIMNISANLLGLGNAATPLGLKAMEELNKLNSRTGTATDAMCTFLVINTSNVQLIPATVIAVRAAAGSADPTEIIGAVILATTVNTVVGVLTVKWLARWKVFRNK
jgi:spore maturation protein A